MLSIIGVILGIVIPSLWIFLPLKKIPREKRLSKGVLIRSILLGATLCTLCIMIPEMIWDRVTGIEQGTVDTLWKAFATSFLRAALIEEAVKFLFVKRALKKHHPEGRLQYMLLAATIGMGYGIVEKLVIGPGAAVFSAFFSFHIMFQFIMGAYLYEADRAETAAAKRCSIAKAFLVPFAVHGAWDTALFAFEPCLDSDSMFVVAIGMLAFLAIIAAGIVAEVKVIRWLKKLPIEEV